MGAIATDGTDNVIYVHVPTYFEILKPYVEKKIRLGYKKIELNMLGFGLFGETYKDFTRMRDCVIRIHVELKIQVKVTVWNKEGWGIYA